MDKNHIITETWSNPESARLYETKWPAEPALQSLYESGEQCGGCSFFALFNADWGLCCHSASRHHLETVFEHFTCPHHTAEGWGPHSFTTDRDFQCRCGGESSEYWDELIKILERHQEKN